MGTCKLCLRENQELKESHLVPAGMYRRIRSNDKNPHPILITKEGSFPCSMQVTDYVLCQECETRFDRGGEDYTLRFSAGNGRFRLLEELEAIKPTCLMKDFRGFAAKDTPKIQRDKLAYFALSVFWRASAHTWPHVDGKGKTPGIQLGVKYNEILRCYLFGETPLPETTMLHLYVVTDRLSQGAFYLPSTLPKKDSCWMYGFFGCGLIFQLTVGQRLERGPIAVSFTHSPDQLIWVRDGEEKTLEALQGVLSQQPPEVRAKREAELRGKS